MRRVETRQGVVGSSGGEGEGSEVSRGIGEDDVGGEESSLESGLDEACVYFFLEKAKAS